MAWNTFDRLAVSIQWETLGTQRHSLIQFHIIADNACFTNYHTCSVVYGEVAADDGTRVDIYSRLAMGHFGDNAGNERNTEPQQFVRNTVIADGAYGWVATDYFSETMCGRVSIVSSRYIRSQYTAHFRQGADELGGNQRSFFTLEFGAATAFAVAGKAKTCKHLLGQ